MSMISSLIDELNKSADEWNGSNMFELARMCREAADTIWQLRDDLQRANTENAKLREELEKWNRLAENIELPEYPVTEFHPKDLERENAKLREQLDTAEHNQTRNAREYARMCHENAKLREELAKARDPQRIGGQADPSSFAYAIEQLREFRWQHATNDENAIPYINNVAAAHERENAKLRELVAELYEDQCDDCDKWRYRDRMRELGVEI